MNAISGVSTQALQYIQANSQPKAPAPAPTQPAQPVVPSAGKDSDGDTDGSVGKNINTYA